jgi:SHS2 domain-containing protein
MPYTYLEDIATADVAFCAQGTTPEELFISAADAMMNVMVDDLATIRHSRKLEIDLRSSDLEMLLFDYLNEIVYLKDARRLLLRAESVAISATDSSFTLHAELYGEEPDAKKHPLKVDVKAVTLHRFSLKKAGSGWEAVVVLDI